MGIAEQLQDAWGEARRAGIKPNFALLGPVHWYEWREWVHEHSWMLMAATNIDITQADYVFNGMKIRRTRMPGITVQADEPQPLPFVALVPWPGK